MKGAPFVSGRRKQNFKILVYYTCIVLGTVFATCYFVLELRFDS